MDLNFFLVTFPIVMVIIEIVAYVYVKIRMRG